MNVEACKECSKNFKTRLWMWKRAKSAGRISRPNYECENVWRVQGDFQDQNMIVEACKECRYIFKTSLWMWICAKSAGRISRPDYECGSVQRVQEEFQNQTMNVEACKDCRYNFKAHQTALQTAQKMGHLIVRLMGHLMANQLGHQIDGPVWAAFIFSSKYLWPKLVGMRVLSPSPQSAATACWSFPWTCSPG